ncbi:MAG: UDP-3-O-acyl-N-acetylglucosamine deacetylase [Rubritepida sp.]|nr:UDP-3-O-acyl-N-acetylglucosamine deacetylase [Rubritepida sp.]
MDGFAPLTLGRRRRLATSIGCQGIGLHSGQNISLTLNPGAPGSGIIFHRTDLGVSIPARHDHVVETRLCTGLGLPNDRSARVGTVEHVMAALAAAGVDDAVVELDGPEVPILDGSADPFLFLIDCAGITEHLGARRTIEVLKTVRVQDDQGAWAELSPSGEMALDAELTIEFGDTAIGTQSFALRISTDSFRSELANARTFTLAEDISRLRSVGLARGGSLANAVVVDGMSILNPGGLRRPDEFVRHKLLDVVGDLALAGSPIAGRFTGFRSGHALNNMLLRKLLADRSAWRYSGGHSLVDADPVRQSVAVAA